MIADLDSGDCPLIWHKQYNYGHATFLMPRDPVYHNDVADILNGKHDIVDPT